MDRYKEMGSVRAEKVETLGRDERSGQQHALDILLSDVARFTARGSEFEDFDPDILRKAERPTNNRAPVLLAFYLPQFHRIPENDQFWGTGFTEWRQLARSIPRFPGHYQPRIPRDLGFYNLAYVDSIAAQAALAKAAGIGGFAFYYYRFREGRVLETPLELLLKHDLDMPFILIWANENWVKVKEGGALGKKLASRDRILLHQDYREEDDEDFLADLARHFSDRRYIRIGGRPLFVVYNPSEIPAAGVALSRWRERLSEMVGIEPLIFMAQTYNAVDPRLYGFDGALEFPPHKYMNTVPKRPVLDAFSSDYAGTVFRYDDFVAASLGDPEPAFDLIRTAVPSWDNDPRYPNHALTLDGASPAKYQAWLSALIGRAMSRPILGTPLVAINAWNEWAECAYLEPDVYYGASYLNATAKAYVEARSF